MHFRTLLSAFNIAPGEGLPVALLLSHSFFMGLAGVLFYTAASAVFLAAVAPTTLPYVYMTSSFGAWQNGCSMCGKASGCSVVLIFLVCASRSTGYFWRVGSLRR